mmetsp:Transcript_28590/g.65359  ORF Transcript_28590/g.65359 Transcript_28590/m.65359 type:complete len:267 (+) Transcript_28590:1198-1998(+)
MRGVQMQHQSLISDRIVAAEGTPSVLPRFPLHRGHVFGPHVKIEILHLGRSRGHRRDPFHQPRHGKDGPGGRRVLGGGGEGGGPRDGFAEAVALPDEFCEDYAAPHLLDVLGAGSVGVVPGHGGSLYVFQPGEGEVSLVSLSVPTLFLGPEKLILLRKLVPQQFHLITLGAGFVRGGHPVRIALLEQRRQLLRVSLAKKRERGTGPGGPRPGPERRKLLPERLRRNDPGRRRRRGRRLRRGRRRFLRPAVDAPLVVRRVDDNAVPL